MDGVEQRWSSPERFTGARKKSGGCYAIETENDKQMNQIETVADVTRES